MKMALAGSNGPLRLVVPTVDVVFRLVVGFALIYSGLLHTQNDYKFLLTTLKYGLLEFELAVFFAAVIPLLQMVLGLTLLASIWRKVTLALVFTLIFLFTVAQVYAFLNGLDIGCGCFGSSEEKIGVWSLFRNFAIITMCVCLYFFPNTKRNEEV